jgi:hypothetical protein
MALVRLLVHLPPHQFVRGFISLNHAFLAITDRHQDEAIIALELESSDIVHSVTPGPGMILHRIRSAANFALTRPSVVDIYLAI